MSGPKLHSQSEFLSSLSPTIRLQLVERLILSARTQFVIQKLTNAEFTSAISPQDQEEILQNYLETGSLRRVSPQEYYLIVFSLLKHTPQALYPKALMNASEFTEEALLQQLPPAAQALFVKVRQFLCESISKSWVSRDFAVESLADALLNYKCTRKVYQQCVPFVSQLLP